MIAACHRSINLPFALNSVSESMRFPRTVTHRAGGVSIGVTVELFKRSPLVVGQRFGWLVTHLFLGKIGIRFWWELKCDCGKTHRASETALKSGGVKSCGCRQHVRQKIAHTPEHDAWKMMMYRCHNPKSSGFKNYGSRGIIVDVRWRKFETFLKDMGPRPQGMSLGRIDNDGNYEPSNCRWETLEQQNNNKRNSRYVTIHGEKKTVTQWANHFGIHPDTAWYRLSMGQTPKEAFER